MQKEIVVCPECGQKMRVPSDKHIVFSCPKCKNEWELGAKISTNNSLHVDNELEEKNDSNLFLDILSYLIAIPMFIILHRLLPDLNWVINLDRILLALITFFLVSFLIQIFRKEIFWGLGFGIAFLTIGQFTSRYGFTDLFRDYKTVVFSIANDPNPSNIISNKLKPFHRKRDFIEAINYQEPEVRNFALKAVRKHFLYYQNEIREYRQFIQAVAIFKEIKPKWNYVNDPNNEEYFAKSSESLQHFSGDCDDYSIVMSACLKAIGCRVKLVHTEGHVFPAVHIGNYNDRIYTEFILKKYLYPQMDAQKNIYYFKDSNDEIWMNMDYTDTHPGGRFMSDKLISSMEM